MPARFEFTRVLGKLVKVRLSREWRRVKPDSSHVVPPPPSSLLGESRSITGAAAQPFTRSAARTQGLSVEPGTPPRRERHDLISATGVVVPNMRSNRNLVHLRSSRNAKFVHGIAALWGQLRTKPRAVSTVASAVTVVTGLLLLSQPAFAAREYTGHKISLTDSRLLALDGVGDLWAQAGKGVVEYGPYPSQTQLPLSWDPGKLHSFEAIGEIHSMAINDPTGNLYFAALFLGEPGSYGVEVFDASGNYKERWVVGSEGDIPNVAVDNSSGPTQGAVLVSQGAPASIEAFKFEHEPIEFSSKESYIEGNKITGSPFGEFSYRPPQTCGCGGQTMPITTDSSGDIYVANGGVVYEFEPSGAFVRRFTGAGAPGGFQPSGLAVDPTNGNLLVETEGAIDEFTSSGKFVEQITGISEATNTGPKEVPFAELGFLGEMAVNPNGYLYVADGGHEVDSGSAREEVDSGVYIFGPAPQEGPKITYEPVTEPDQHSGTLHAQIEPQAGEEITSCDFEYGTNTQYKLGKIPCSPNPDSDSAPIKVSAQISGLTPEIPYHYRLALTTNKGGSEEFTGQDQRYTPHFVIGIETGEATEVKTHAMKLHGSFIGNGEATSYYFEYGTGPSYGEKTEEVTLPAPSGPTEVEAEITGLNPVTVYHYRLVAKDAGLSHANDRQAETLPLPPEVSGEVATSVHSDTAVLHTLINPGGGHTTYRFEYGPAPCSSEPDPCSSTPEVEIGTGFANLPAQVKLSGLSATTTYHWRVLATNATTTTDGEEETFNTFPEIAIVNDPCPNAHVRQQTGAAFLLDCRAYELVSAANTGGYDVESNLVAGQTPYGGYPEAENPSRVLYGVNDGGIPGTDHPTNKGVDPYVATRGKEGWSTQYVGIPADNPFSILPFSSTPSGAGASLGTFAFGGAGGCSPCFGPGGIETGIPVRLPNGELTQGMVGAPGFEPGSEATPDGYIAQDLSANGTHFIFGSTSPFAQGGNDSTGPVSIYDRNLSSGETHVVSNAPAGGPLPCLQNTAQGECHAPKDSNGISELAISADGTHILLGQKVSEDADTTSTTASTWTSTIPPRRSNSPPAPPTASSLTA